MKQKSDFKKYLFLKIPLITIIIIIILLFSCKVVKLKDKTSEKDFDIYFEDENFDADKIVNDIWNCKVLPYMIEKANDITDVVTAILNDPENAGKQYGAKEKKEGEQWNFVVSGEGAIKRLDTTSRAGILILNIPSIKNFDIIIQIGPVIKGTSIRDSLDFISFDQFVNQIEFASLSNSFNKRVLEEVLKNIEFDQKIGKTLKFYGTFTMFDDPSKIIITPVKMEIK